MAQHYTRLLDCCQVPQSREHDDRPARIPAFNGLPNLSLCICGWAAMHVSSIRLTGLPGVLVDTYHPSQGVSSCSQPVCCRKYSLTVCRC